jgi:chromate reductase
MQLRYPSSIPTASGAEDTMARILAMSGSLRKASFNTALLRAARSLAGPSSSMELATLHGIPLYDADVERKDGLPDAVIALKERVVAADGVLLASPEYNNGIPGVFKNAIDWLSRPPEDIPRVFRGRPFAVIGASPGGFGTVLAQAAWLPVLRTLGVRNWSGGRLMVSRAGAAFDDQGELRDDAVRERLAEFIRGFAAFADE